MFLFAGITRAEAASKAFWDLFSVRDSSSVSPPIADLPFPARCC